MALIEKVKVCLIKNFCSIVTFFDQIRHSRIDPADVQKSNEAGSSSSTIRNQTTRANRLVNSSRYQKRNRCGQFKVGRGGFRTTGPSSRRNQNLSLAENSSNVRPRFTSTFESVFTDFPSRKLPKVLFEKF